MHALRTWFKPPCKYRNFALLDNEGTCRALKQCTLPPSNGNWVEVDDLRLNWLQHTLPASARIKP